VFILGSLKVQVFRKKEKESKRYDCGYAFKQKAELAILTGDEMEQQLQSI